MERHEFDVNQPQGAMSLMNLRNALRGLFQGDVQPLRARASYILDDMEYPSDASAQAQWSGEGCSIAKSTTVQEGNYSLSVTIDETGNRKVSKSQALNLSGFYSAKIWERVNVASSEFQFYLRDNNGNESYWDLVSSGTSDTWKQDQIVLSSPDSNSGTPANLSNIVQWGFLGLDASKVYLFDTVKCICGLNVAVESAIAGSFYQNVYIGQTKVSFSGGSSPIITPPTTNARISLLVLSDSGVLSWVNGAESSTPSEPTFPSDKLPICLVYCKTTMSKVVDYIDKDANPNEAYILKDVRPSINLNAPTEILSGNNASKPSTYILNRFYWATDVNKLFWDDGSQWVDITPLIVPIDTDNTLGSNSDTKIASQKATKTYADGKVAIPAGGAVGDILYRNASAYTRLPIGTANKVLKSNGTAPVWGAMAGGGFSNMQVFTSNGTWVKPANVNKVYVKVQGGGGGAGGCSHSYTGGSGGAGGYSEAIVSVSGNVSVVVGNGGSGGAGGGANGVDGGQSYFNASGGNIRATGGGKGIASGYLGAGGAGGVGSNGNLNLYGGNGGSGGNSAKVSSSGGSSVFGGAGEGVVGANGERKQGINAKPNTGAGGSSGTPDGTANNVSGGSGGSGIVIVYWNE